jgi:hypothetical protein
VPLAERCELIGTALAAPSRPVRGEAGIPFTAGEASGRDGTVAASAAVEWLSEPASQRPAASVPIARPRDTHGDVPGNIGGVPARWRPTARLGASGTERSWTTGVMTLQPMRKMVTQRVQR